MAGRPTSEWMMRACFWLLAILLLGEMLTTMGVLAGCAWAVLVQRSTPMGGCAQAGEQVRQIWGEALATILALLLAAKSGTGGPPPDDGARGE